MPEVVIRRSEDENERWGVPEGAFNLQMPEKLERVAGIEPAYSAWKAAALPLSYTRGGLDPKQRNGGGSWI